jgi:hypothetical protein
VVASQPERVAGRSVFHQTAERPRATQRLSNLNAAAQVVVARGRLRERARDDIPLDNLNRNVADLIRQILWHLRGVSDENLDDELVGSVAVFLSLTKSDSDDALERENV